MYEVTNPFRVTDYSMEDSTGCKAEYRRAEEDRKGNWVKPGCWCVAGDNEEVIGREEHKEEHGSPKMAMNVHYVYTSWVPSCKGM